LIIWGTLVKLDRHELIVESTPYITPEREFVLDRAPSPEYRSFEELKIGSERNFGIIFSIAFAIIAFWPLTGGGAVRLWSLAISVIFLVTAFVVPHWLKPLNRIWFRLGILLGKIVTPLVMGFLFFTTVTPIALLLRIFRKDLLRLHQNAAADTYWLPRTPPGPVRGSLKDQF
jgi:hypothetical protein